jgi:hypothetical protein
MQFLVVDVKTQLIFTGVAEKYQKQIPKNESRWTRTPVVTQ